MAAAYSTSGAAGDDAGGTTRDSPSLVIPAGAVVYAFVNGSDGSPAAPTGVSLDPTGTPQAFTKIGDSGVFASFAYASLWVLKNASAVTAVTRATWAASQGERMVTVWVGTGIDTTTPNGTVATGTGTTTAVSATAASTSGQLCVQFAGHLFTGASARTYNTPSGNERTDAVISGVPYDGAASQDQTGGSPNTTMTWTLSGTIDGWYSFAFALNDAGGGGGSTELPPLTMAPLRGYGR